MKRYGFAWIFLGLLLAACQSAAPVDPVQEAAQELVIPPVPTLSASEIALGERVYIEQCASCHGPNLEGEAEWKNRNEDGSFRAPPHDATGHTWHHSDDQLLDAVRLGGARLAENMGAVSGMPAFSDTLSDEEIRAVLDYIKSSWPDDVRRMQWEATVRMRARDQ